MDSKRGGKRKKKKKEVKENGDLRSTAAVTMLSCEDSLGSVIV